jgi:hypothetical protein
MIEPTCQCSVCISRVARGEAPFEGISVSTSAHVTAEELTATPQQTSERITPSHVRALEARIDRLAAEIDRLVEAVGTSIGNAVHEAVAPLKAEVTALKNAMLRPAGVWTQGKRNRVNDIVCHGGSSFICTADTDAKPGTSAAWLPLAVRGRDGRDLTPPAPPEPRTVRSHRNV